MPRIWIAVDAVGGDDFPSVPIAGAILALKELRHDLGVTLVGPTDVIEAELRRHHYDPKRIRVCPASQVIAMNEKPSVAVDVIDSSISTGLALQRQGLSDGFVSAGNTGAIMALALLKLGRIHGIKRPALAVPFPTAKQPCVVLDVGATMDATSEQLGQFSLMGPVYSELIHGIKDPSVGLMSVGEEDGKGNKVTQAAYKLLQTLGSKGAIRFTGNVQGKDILTGNTNVIVIDGFAGNVVLKLTESFLPAFKDLLKKIIQNGGKWQKFWAWVATRILLTPTIKSVKLALEAEEYGGAPLLGVRGVVIVAHGNSTPKAIVSAVNHACCLLQYDISGVIEKRHKQFAACFEPAPGE